MNAESLRDQFAGFRLRMAFFRTRNVLLASVVLAATAVGARDRVVAAVPHTAALYAAAGLSVNLDRLRIGPATATMRIENDLRTLVVESEITNPQSVPLSAPLLRLSIRDRSGATVYTWTASPGAKTVAAGARLPIRARLTAPPAGEDVVVEFVRGG